MPISRKGCAKNIPTQPTFSPIYPGLIVQAKTNLIASLHAFCTPEILALADAMNIHGVSVKVNGGENVINERFDWTHRWQHVFGI